jgi:hypothetical protein
MSHVRTALAIGLAALLVLAAAPIAAQTTSGALTGTVLDDTGLPLPGATVTVTSPDLVRGTASAVTDASGAFRFPSLPPSTYTVEVTLQGFRSVRKENVRLGLGQTLSLPVRMELPSVAAEAVVTAEAPLVSVVSNSVAGNLTSEFIQRQPVSRNQTSIVNITPGVKDGLAYGGTQSASNAYSLDGVNVSDPASGEQWILPNVDWLKEVQVSGLGADAEVGGFTGAAINLVTKSGGNTLSGDVTAYYSGGDLNSSNSSDPDLTPAKVDSETDFAANVGGAFKKDLLWFFVSGNEVKSEVQRQGAQNTDVRKYSRYLGKFTLQLNEGNKLVGLLDYDGVTHDRRGISLYTYESASTRQESPNWSYNLTWESMLSSSSFLELKATGFTGADDRLPYGAPDTPGRADAESGISWQNATYTNFVDNSRLSFDGAWSLFADGLIAKNDSHRFKIGINYEQAEADEIRTRNGGFTYYDDSYYCDSLDAYFADPSCALYSSDRGNDINLQSVNKGLSAYIQDSWQVSRFTVNAGVRYTRYEAGFRNGDEGVYAPGDLFAPRIGIVWDVFGTAKTAVKAHWGRYYEGLFTYLYDREESGQVFTPTTYWDYNFDTGAFDIPVGGGSTNRAALDPSIGHPYMDQLVVSLEQQVGRDLTFGVDYARRENSDIVAFANVVDDYDALVAPAGVFKDANGNQVAAGDLPFYDLLSRPSNVLLNPADAYRQYDAVFLRAEKRYSNGWSARASVVWSESKGNTFAANGYTSEWADRNGQTNADGLLPRNSEWEVKVSGSVDLPWGLLASAYYQFYSGENWTPTVLIRGLYRNDRQTVFLNERGSERLPDRNLLDLKLSKQFRLGARTSITVFADAFNVLNSDTALSVDNNLGTYRYDYEDHPTGSTFQARSAYGTILSIERPREIRLGARFSF